MSGSKSLSKMSIHRSQKASAAGHDRVLRGTTRVKRSYSEAFTVENPPAAVPVISSNNTSAGGPRRNTLGAPAPPSQASSKKRDMKEPEEPHTPDCPLYPARSQTLPSDISCYDLCRQYPNHLFGSRLDAFLQHGFSASAVQDCLPANFKTWLRDHKKGKNGNWGNKYTKDCKTQDLDRNEVNVFQKRIDKRKAKLRKIGEYGSLLSGPKQRPDGRPTELSSGRRPSFVRSRSTSTVRSQADSASVPSPPVVATFTESESRSPITRGSTPVAEVDAPKQRRTIKPHDNASKSFRLASKLHMPSNSKSRALKHYQRRDLAADPSMESCSQLVPEYHIVQSVAVDDQRVGTRSAELTPSDQPGGIIGFTTVLLPIVQAPNGAIVQLKPRLDFHGHVDDVDEITDSTIRDWYEKTTFDGISAEPAFTLPSGKVYDIFIAADVVGHVGDLESIRDPEIRRALGL